MRKINTAIAVGILGVSLFGCNLLERYKIEDNTTPSPTSILTTIPTEAPEVKSLPNAIFMGEFEGKKVLYLENSSERDFIITQFLEESNDTFSGSDKYSSSDNLKSFEQLSNPILVYQGKSKEEIYLGYSILKDGILYLAFHYDSTNTFSYPDKSAILKFDVENSKVTRLLEKDLFGSETEGTAYNVVEVFDNKYMVYYVSGCYGCGDWISRKVYVLNLDTMENVFLGDNVAGFEVNNGQISFRQLVEVETIEDCVADICGIYKPEGELETIELP